MNAFIFIVVVALWVGFFAALMASQGSIDATWRWFLARPLIVQIPLGIVLLPWLVATWIWETSWTFAWRLLLVSGLAWATLYAFFPWRIQ